MRHLWSKFSTDYKDYTSNSDDVCIFRKELNYPEHKTSHTVSPRGWSCVWGCLVLWGVNPCCFSCLWWEREVQASLSVKKKRKKENILHQISITLKTAHGCELCSGTEHLSLMWLRRALSVKDQLLMDRGIHAWGTAEQSRAITLVLLYTQLSIKAAFIMLAWEAMRASFDRKRSSNSRSIQCHCTWRYRRNLIRRKGSQPADGSRLRMANYISHHLVLQGLYQIQKSGRNMNQKLNM